MNLGLAVVSMFTGAIVDQAGYVTLEIFFIGLLLGLILFTIQLQYFQLFGTEHIVAGTELWRLLDRFLWRAEIIGQ
jgi:hypothetical protein